MNFTIYVKNTIILILLVAVGGLGFYSYFLAGFGATSLDIGEPPKFVEQYAAKFSPAPITSSPVTDNQGEQQVQAKWTRDFYNEAALVRNVILNGESPDKLIQLFTHPEKEIRVKIAFAFSVVNIMMSHDYGSGFPEKREQFWKATTDHHLDIQNALFEAMIVSAKEQTRNHIPYTAAWMPINEENKLQFLAWAANHHPDSWVRRFSFYYIAEFGENEQLTASLMKDRIDDPSYIVRKEVLDQYYSKYLAL